MTLKWDRNWLDLKMQREDIKNRAHCKCKTKTI